MNTPNPLNESMKGEFSKNTLSTDFGAAVTD
jgi:hypothetical protein